MTTDAWCPDCGQLVAQPVRAGDVVSQCAKPECSRLVLTRTMPGVVPEFYHWWDGESMRVEEFK